MSPINEHTDIHSLSCYRSFIDSGPQWIRQCWGDAISVGWRGTPAQQEAAYNTFVNYDARPRDSYGVSPNPPLLSIVYDNLSYIYLTEERLTDTLTLLFEVLIGMETGWWQQVGEDPDDREWVTNGELVDKLALRAAEAFIRDHMTTECFVPDPIQPLIAEHSLGRPDRLEYDKVENLADSAISA